MFYLSISPSAGSKKIESVKTIFSFIKQIVKFNLSNYVFFPKLLHVDFCTCSKIKFSDTIISYILQNYIYSLPLAY